MFPPQEIWKEIPIHLSQINLDFLHGPNFMLRYEIVSRSSEDALKRAAPVDDADAALLFVD